MYAVGVPKIIFPNATWTFDVQRWNLKFQLVRVDGIIYWEGIGFTSEVDGILVLNRPLTPLNSFTPYYLFEESDLE